MAQPSLSYTRMSENPLREEAGERQLRNSRREMKCHDAQVKKIDLAVTSY